MSGYVGQFGIKYQVHVITVSTNERMVQMVVGPNSDGSTMTLLMRPAEALDLIELLGKAADVARNSEV